MGEQCECGEDTCENSAGGNPNRTEALLFRVLRSEIGKMKQWNQGTGGPEESGSVDLQGRSFSR